MLRFCRKEAGRCACQRNEFDAVKRERLVGHTCSMSCNRRGWVDVCGSRDGGYDGLIALHWWQRIAFGMCSPAVVLKTRSKEVSRVSIHCYSEQRFFANNYSLLGEILTRSRTNSQVAHLA